MPLEQDKSGGFKFSLDQEVNTGLWPDVFSRRIPLWETGSNIQFTEFGVEKAKGRENIVETGLGQPIRGLLQNVRQETQEFSLHFGDLTQLYDYNTTSTALTVRGTGYNLVEDTGSSAWDAGASTWDSGISLWDDGITKASQWSMLSYGDFILATNGADFPQIYKPSLGPNYADLVGTDLGPSGTIEIFISRGPHVLGFNTNISPKEFIWCDADNPDDWIAADDNLAGQLEIRELKTGIIAAVPLGGRIAVYGADQMFVVNYLGNDLVFGYQPALNGVGAVSKGAIVPVGRQNFGLSSQGFFVTDGSTFDYIDDPAMRHWFKNNVNQNQEAKVVGYHDEENTQIRWYFPSTIPSSQRAVTYNYEKGAWSFITGNISAVDERRITKSGFGGTETGWLTAEGVGDNDRGAPMVSYVRTKPMDVGSADLIKELDSIRLGYRGTGVQYRIGWSETENSTINWTEYTSMEKGFDFQNLRTAGRWLYIELYTNSLNTSWEVMSMEVIGRTEGTR